MEEPDDSRTRNSRSPGGIKGVGNEGIRGVQGLRPETTLAVAASPLWMVAATLLLAR